jgi:hypothetical protein
VPEAAIVSPEESTVIIAFWIPDAVGVKVRLKMQVPPGMIVTLWQLVAKVKRALFEENVLRTQLEPPVFEIVTGIVLAVLFVTLPNATGFGLYPNLQAEGGPTVTVTAPVAVMPLKVWPHAAALRSTKIRVSLIEYQHPHTFCP